MKINNKLNSIIEKLIDFDNINVGFKVEFKDRENKKIYVLTENENGYFLEIKKGNRSIRINLHSSKDLQNQEKLLDKDKIIFFKLFDRLNSNQVDKISISGLRLRNPILTASIGQSIIANVSKQILSEDVGKLYLLWKERKKEEFEEKFMTVITKLVVQEILKIVNTWNDFDKLEKIKKEIDKMIDISNIKAVKFEKDKKGKIKIRFEKNNPRNPQVTIRNPVLDASLRQAVTNNISNILNSKKYDRVRDKLYKLWEESKRNRNKKDEFDLFLRNTIVDTIFDYIFKLESYEKDLPTPIFPTSVALSETPNYYICEPQETYTLATKIELFNKLADTKCGKCGQRIYGVYVPEDWVEAKEILKNTKYFPDFYNANILALAGIGEINPSEIGPFEYLFYLLDKLLQEMFRKFKRDVIPNHIVELFVIEGVGGGKKFFSHYVIPNLNEVFSKLYHGNDKYTSYGISKIKALISSFLVENWKIDNSLKNNNSEIAHAHINRLLYFIFCHKKLDMDSILFLEDLKIKLGDTIPIRYLEEVMSWM